MLLVVNYTMQMQKITDVHVLREFITDDKCAVVYDSGFTLPITKVCIQDIPIIVRAVTLHSTLMPIKSELDQLTQGLEICGILPLIRKYPRVMKELFMYNPDDKITVELMMGMFDVKYSEQGSSRRELEERTIQFWNEFLIDVGNSAISKSLFSSLFSPPSLSSLSLWLIMS